MMGPNHVDVTAAVHDSEWRVRVALPAGVTEVFLSAGAAKDASQRLFHIALEISEREGQPQGASDVDVLRERVKALQRSNAEALERIKRLEKELENEVAR